MRKYLGAGIGAAAALALLTACGGGSDPAQPAATQEADDAPSTDAELVVWSDAERAKAIENAAEKFEKETGATVTVVQKNFEDLRTDFLAQVPTGEGPDITIGAHDWLGEFVESGVVDTIDLGERADAFEQVTLDALTYDGQLYGLPYAQESVALIQNTDLVGDKAPETWDEMIKMSKDAGFEKRPFILYTNGSDGDMYTAYPFQTSFGAPVLTQNDDGSYTTEVAMGGESGMKYAKWLYDNGSAGTKYFTDTISYDIGNDLFSSGKSPFIVQGPWVTPIYQDAGINIKVSPVPSAGGQTSSPFVGVQAFYLSAQSKNALLATDFLTNYMSTEEAQRALYKADPRTPALTSVAEQVADDSIMAGFLSSAQNGVPMPSIPEMGSIWDYWNAAQMSLIKGEKPENVWPKMIDAVNKAVAK